uniref:Uncharacterized protein n=1 Tax=Haptolina ericina TaxID=156174 RepID=A0A7S3AEW8_9EUKA|mmetsp:Transcript_15435/g.34516  ORF Transcript_15435/g.34516 Transcript_15435/m.34516 type:complete len:303 (+) Transcript_15435:2-910(+)
MNKTPWSFLGDLLPTDLVTETTKSVSSYLSDELCPPDVEGALCSTHWLPIEHLPQHTLEASVVAVGETIIRLASVQDVVGFEWWLQEQWPGDLPKELHTDADVSIGSSQASVRYPLMSSVLYLSETGGPTAVFDQRSVGGVLEPISPSAVALAFPRPGSLLMFDGSLLHCVLHPPSLLATMPTEMKPRRTLLVNLWARKPEGATHVPLEMPAPAPAWDGLRERLHGVRPGLGLAERSPMMPQVRTHLTLEIRVPVTHAEDAESWAAQRMPGHLVDRMAEARGEPVMPKLVVIRYGCLEGIEH